MDENRDNIIEEAEEEEDDHVYTYDIDEIDRYINSGPPAMMDAALEADIKYREQELQRIMDENMDEEEINYSRARAMAKLIEKNKRKASKKDVMIIKLSDEQKQEICEGMQTTYVRSNHNLRYHKSDEEIYDSKERKEIFHKLSKLQKSYYSSAEWIEAMKTIIEAIEFSLNHDYPWLNHKQAIEMFNEGRIKFTFCQIPNLWTSWTHMITDPKTLKGVLSGDIVIESFNDKNAHAKKRKRQKPEERDGIDYNYEIMSDEEFKYYRDMNRAGYATPIDTVLNALKGTFSRFSLPESNYFFKSNDVSKNENKPIGFDWSEEGAGEKYYDMIHGKKKTFEDVIDLVAKENNNMLRPSFRSDMMHFANNIGNVQPIAAQSNTYIPNQYNNNFITDIEKMTAHEVELEKHIMDQMMIL